MEDNIESIDQLPKVIELPIIQIFGYDGKTFFQLILIFLFAFVKLLLKFSGKIPLRVHPDQEHLVFAIGNKISILNIKTNKQEFFSGHTHNISTLEISPSGRLVASGQINHMGFRAHLIVWDWRKRHEILRHELHKVRVQDLVFSSDEEHIISLGGKDCGMIIVWNINKK